MINQAFINPLIIKKFKLNHYNLVKLYYDDDKYQLTSKNEPKEFFMTNLDKKTDIDKLNDPIVLLGLLSILFPFFILLIFWDYIQDFKY